MFFHLLIGSANMIVFVHLIFYVPFLSNLCDLSQLGMTSSELSSCLNSLLAFRSALIITVITLRARIPDFLFILCLRDLATFSGFIFRQTWPFNRMSKPSLCRCHSFMNIILLYVLQYSEAKVSFSTDI